jgi:hypothetical protein
MHFILGIFLNLCRSTKPWADPLSASSAIACTRWSLVAMLVPGILVMDCKPSAVRAASEVTVVTIHSVALENNLLGDPPDQKVAIFLPAEYAQRSNQRFAVVYFLHGFDDTAAPEVGQVVQRIIDPWMRSWAAPSGPRRSVQNRLAQRADTRAYMSCSNFDSGRKGWLIPPVESKH